MVINGGSRAGAGELASHLARTDTNERMEVRELRGLATDNLREGLQQMEGIAAGTRCRKSLYHANINAGPNDPPLTPEQEARTIDRLEQRLGLEGQPRAIVAHVKHGRAHLHVVWSRIDQTTMRAVSDSHNYRVHEQVARELEREFGHAQVRGAHDRADQPRPPRAPPAAELQQAARTKQDPARITAEVTRVWERADKGHAFVQALNEAGYVLAQGERRGFCIIDQAGGVHSLARRIKGATSKQVGAKLAGIEMGDLPTVAQARAQVRDQARIRDGLALPKHERPAARLSRELTRPEAERAERQARQVTDRERADQSRERERADPDGVVKALWNRIEDGRDLATALQEAGFRLASGEMRTFYTVDRMGRVSSLPEQTGATFSEVGRRLAHLDIDRLPTVEQVQAGHIPDLVQATRSKPERKARPPDDKPRLNLSLDAKGIGRAARRAGGAVADRATGGFMGLVVGLLGRAAKVADRATTTPKAREENQEKHPPAAPSQPPAARAPAPAPASAPAPPPRSVAQELIDRARARVESKPRQEIEPPRDRERERSRFAVPTWTIWDTLAEQRRARVESVALPTRPVASDQGRRESPVRPTVRLLGAALPDHHSVAWAVQVRARLMAYAAETGEFVLTELEHLNNVISGAYLRLGLTLTGRQCMEGGPA